MGKVTREWLNSILGQNIGRQGRWIHVGPIVRFDISFAPASKAVITVVIRRGSSKEERLISASDRSYVLDNLNSLGISLFPDRAPTPVES